MTPQLSQRQIVVLTVTAAAILMITMGVRQTSGLYLLPVTESTGVSVVAFSFALAIGQFVFGMAQPIGAAGWMSAMFMTAAAALLTIPLTFGTRYIATLFGSRWCRTRSAAFWAHGWAAWRWRRPAVTNGSGSRISRWPCWSR